MNLNVAHIHLLLNHLPIIGTLVGLLLLAAAFFRKSDELKRVGFTAFVITALITIPVYLTGEPAANIVEKLPDVTEALVDTHKDAATISFIAVGILGVVALWGLWRYRRADVIPHLLVILLLAMSVVASGLMMWTGFLGGQIRHTEVRADLVVAVSGEEKVVCCEFHPASVIRRRAEIKRFPT